MPSANLSLIQHVQRIGGCGLIDFSGLEFTVRITDVKQAYGTIRYAVTPVSGIGSVWVNADRVSNVSAAE